MSADVHSAPATLRVLRGLQDGVSERRRLEAAQLSPEAAARARSLANAALGLARSDRARAVLSACLAQVSRRSVDRFHEAANLALERVQAVLDGRVDAHDDPLFNPAVCLRCDTHGPEDLRALSCALMFATTHRLPSCVVDGFFELESVPYEEQDERWVGVRLELGEAGRYDYGAALAIVDVETREVHWLDPDCSIV